MKLLASAILVSSLLANAHSAEDRDEDDHPTVSKGDRHNKNDTSAVPKASAPLRTTRAICKVRSPLIFSPAALSFSDTDGGQSFTVVLGAAPAGPVSYRLAGTNLLFDHCVVSFNTHNWSKPHKVHMMPLLSKGNPSQIKVSVQAIGQNGAVKASMPVVRTTSPAIVGQSSGDPHYSMFTGKVVSQQKDTVNYLFKSPDFDVQALQQKCNAKSSVYCNKAVAIRFGDSVYTYDTSGAQNLNNPNTTVIGSKYIVVAFDGPTVPGFEYDPPTTAKASYDFTLPDQTFVTITPSKWTTGYGVHTTIKISLSPSLAATGAGTLGNVAAKGFQIIGSDGVVGNASIAADVTHYFNSWAVPTQHNYFLGNDPVGEADMPFYRSCDAAGIVQRIARKSEHHLLPSYSGVWERAVEDLSSVNVTYTAAQIKAEVQACRAIFSGLDLCQKLVASAPYEETCVRDGLLVGGDEVMDHHLNSYLTECGDVAASLKDRNSTLALVARIETKYGFSVDV